MRSGEIQVNLTGMKHDYSVRVTEEPAPSLKPANHESLGKFQAKTSVRILDKIVEQRFFR